LLDIIIKEYLSMCIAYYLNKILIYKTVLLNKHFFFLLFLKLEENASNFA